MVQPSMPVSKSPRTCTTSCDVEAKQKWTGKKIGKGNLSSMRAMQSIARGMTRASSAMSMPKITALHTRVAFVGLDFCACGTFEHIISAIF
jgi:hypothetical protein